MARAGRPAKPIELHKRQGTYRPDRHGPKPMLASPRWSARRRWWSRSAFDDHQCLCPDCAAPVDLELFANRSWPYVHPETGGAACVWHRSTPD